MDNSTKVSVLAGLPISGAVVWLLENFYLKPRGLTLDPTSTVVAGGLGALILGELFKDIGEVYRALINKVLEKLK